MQLYLPPWGNKPATSLMLLVAAAKREPPDKTNILLGHTLNVMVRHAVATLLLQCCTNHLTKERLTKYQCILLLDPSISLHKCSGLNPITLLPITASEIECWQIHDCVAEIAAVSNVHPDLQHLALEEAKCNMFTDESAR